MTKLDNKTSWIDETISIMRKEAIFMYCTFVVFLLITLYEFVIGDLYHGLGTGVISLLFLYLYISCNRRLVKLLRRRVD